MIKKKVTELKYLSTDLSYVRGGMRAKYESILRTWRKEIRTRLVNMVLELCMYEKYNNGIL